MCFPHDVGGLISAAGSSSLFGSRWLSQVSVVTDDGASAAHVPSFVR